MKLDRAFVSDAFALAAISIAIASPSIWGRLYFQNNSVGFLVAVGAVVLAALLGLTALVCRVVPALQPQRLLGSLVLALAAVWIVVAAGGGTLARSPLTAVLPAAIAAGAFGYWARAPTRSAWWPRSRTALTVAGSIFFASSPVIGYWVSRDIALLPTLAADLRVPTVWLLLDETSFGASEQLAAPLRERGLWVLVAELESAGRNTLDIVPSMVARRVMGSGTAPCGPTVLCAGQVNVDFARIDVGRPGVDMVGVYHRYCSIRGLRSCVKDTRRTASWQQQVADLACGAARWLGSEERCLRELAEHDLDVRRLAIRATFDAPFWREGGDLFVHVLLPHLPATVDPAPSLGEAYEQNVGSAADLLASIADRLQQRFSDYRLVVFSDHALRPIDRCNAAYSGRCERPSKYADPFTVPLIVAAPAALRIDVPESNLHVLDLDLDLRASH